LWRTALNQSKGAKNIVDGDIKKNSDQLVRIKNLTRDLTIQEPIAHANSTAWGQRFMIVLFDYLKVLNQAPDNINVYQATVDTASAPSRSTPVLPAL